MLKVYSYNTIRLITASFVAVVFLFSSLLPGHAQILKPTPVWLVKPGEVAFVPVLKGIKINPENPWHMDFIVDPAGQMAPSADEVGRLVKYFLAAITIPESDFWVNLSPYEKNRIVPQAFSQTEMGRDLLNQDYVLKQITATLLSPENAVGKKFWADVYAQVQEKFGTIDIPIDSINKVWIVPQKAQVFERRGGSVTRPEQMAYITQARLKVMLDTDYVAMNHDAVGARHGVPEMASLRPILGEEASSVHSMNDSGEISKNILREIILPALEKEVNEGANFAPLRQIYHSLILAVWYKKRFAGGALSKAYLDQKKIYGVRIKNPGDVEQIYGNYVGAFNAGAFNVVREEKDADSDDVVLRKYLVGGFSLSGTSQILENAQTAAIPSSGFFEAAVDFSRDAAQASGYIENTFVRAAEGASVVLRAIMDNPDLRENYDVFLYSNRDGSWKEDPLKLSFAGIENGNAVFQTKFQVERSFEYTFMFCHILTGAVEWADLPYGNGRVWVDRHFKGKIAFVGMEFKPLVMKGGQGDVMYDLPKSLVKQGNDVTVILPYFKGLADSFKDKYLVEDVPGFEYHEYFNYRSPVTLKAKKVVIDGIKVIMLDAVDAPDLFDKPYLGKKQEFYESILLSKGSLELLKFLGEAPDHIVSSDHHAALVSLYMTKLPGSFLEKTGSVFTIHNIGYQGEYLGIFQFLQSEWASLDDIIPLLKAMGQPKLKFKNLEGAVKWLNEDITFFRWLINQHLTEQPMPKYIVAMFPQDFDTMSDLALSEFAHSFEGERLKRESLSYFLPSFMPKGLDALGRLIQEIGLNDTRDIDNLLIKDGKMNFMAVPPGVIKKFGGKGRYVNTVSNTYAKDIRQTEFETDKLLQDIGDRFGGIVNGIDLETANPETDPYIKQQYKPVLSDAVMAKKINKSFLQYMLGKDQPAPEKDLVKYGYLNENSPNILIEAIQRIVQQKQLDILADILEDIRDGRREALPVDIVVGGPADKQTDDLISARRLIALAQDEKLRKRGVNLVVLHGFVRAFGSLSFGGSDAMFAISDFEPCGVRHQQAMRFGTLPIVRRTGGMADTVFDTGDKRNGFAFNGTFRRMNPKEDVGARQQNVDELYLALKEAVRVYRTDQQEWQLRMQNGMAVDSGWETRSVDYNNVFVALKEELTADAAMDDQLGGINLMADALSLETSGRLDQALLISRESSLEQGVPFGLTPIVKEIFPVSELNRHF
ncbi:MAG: glycogen/starch synthase [Candidatus Omnitrophota bacterium]